MKSPSILDAPPERRRGAPALAGLGAAAVHGVIVLLAIASAGVAHEVGASLAVTEMVDVELPAPPPEPEEKPPEPPPEPPPPVSPQKAPSKETPPVEPPPEAPPPPAAAQAGQVLTANEEVLDFGNTFVTGAGSSYAGGITDSQGTSARAVRDTAARGAMKPSPPPPPAVNRSRPPQLAGGMRWDCPFPPEADDAEMNHAVVTLRIEVSAQGDVRTVRAVSDPGFGFARVARRCAISKRWVPGLDREGKAIEAGATINVRFDR